MLQGHRSPRLPRTTADRRESVDQSKRRLNVCVWDNGVPTKRYMSIAELRNTILAKVRINCFKIILYPDH